MKKSLSLLLTLCMLLGMLSVPALAQENTQVPQSLEQGQFVLFGGNQWLVLDGEKDNAGEAGIFLVSADVVEEGIQFNAGGLSNAWADSDAKAWAAEYAAGFSAAELSAIKTVSKSEEADENWIAASLDNEQVFFLSAQEVQTYLSDCAAGNGWWLRSGAYNGKNSIFAGAVSDVGIVGTPHVAAKYDARPALNLDWSKIAVLKYVEEDTFEVALLDEARSFTASAIVNADSLEITYSGANTGSNEYVTAVFCDADGKPVYTADVAVSSAAGTATVQIPEELAVGQYNVYVFSELRNEGRATDFASAPVVCPVTVEDPMGDVASWNLTLGDHLTLQFYVNVKNAEAAKITVGSKTVTQQVSEAAKDENGYCIFTADVAAAQMTEQVKLQLVTGDAAGAVHSYSVREYANAVLADETKAYCHDLVKEMLNYGAKAQLYFGVNTDELANAGITSSNTQAPTEADEVQISGKTEGVQIQGATLVLKAKIAVRYYFAVTGDVADYTFTANGEACTAVKSAEGQYYVEVSNINPQDLDQAITVCVNDGLSVTYSPMNYMVRMSEKGSEALQELICAMYGYHLAAKNYIV